MNKNIQIKTKKALKEIIKNLMKEQCEIITESEITIIWQQRKTIKEIMFIFLSKH